MTKKQEQEEQKAHEAELQATDQGSVNEEKQKKEEKPKKEAEAKKADLEDADFEESPKAVKKEKTAKSKAADLDDDEDVSVKKEKEAIESEADPDFIHEVKSNTWITPEGDFDWDKDDKGFGNYSDEERAKLEEQYAGTFHSITQGEIIEGTVVSFNNKDVVLNVGFKSDGLVSIGEFRDLPDLAVGDKVDVFVESQEDANGQLVLSRKRAKTQRSWEAINEALENDSIINGFVKSRTKGGLIVDIQGVEAFLPGSQIDIKPIRDYDIYVGKTMEFKVVKINHEFKNVVVSHKVLIEDDLEQQKAEIVAKLEKGQVLEGTVKNITDFGVFIDLGGVDGLLHITDISWGRIEHPKEVLALDEKINVVVLDFDDEKKRIALGMKQLTPHPWESLDDSLEVGSTVKGKIVTVADYGAFLEIIPGVEGLIHVSEMSWSQNLRSPQDFLKVGDVVEAQVLTLDREERKMSLGIKQLTPDPWKDIASRYPVGSKQSAVVKNMTNFGVFVELEEGIDGLIHISDLSWSKKINHPNEFTKPGETLEVVVLEVDEENRKLSLGHKQLEENPWETFETIFTVDSLHEGTVLKVSDKGAIVALSYGVEGFCPSKHSIKEDGSALKVDDTDQFKVIEFNKEAKRIVISHSRIWEDERAEARVEEFNARKKEAKAASGAVKKVKDSVEKSTLGDIDVLAKLKQQMEGEEESAKKTK